MQCVSMNLMIMTHLCNTVIEGAPLNPPLPVMGPFSKKKKKSTYIKSMHRTHVILTS